MSKIKRPEKIQTSINGSGGTNSTSTSPALSAKRPPSSVILPPSAGINGIAAASSSRMLQRRQNGPPGQLLGRGQRTSSAGLRSASIVTDAAASQIVQSRPYIQSDSYILKKYQGCPPSLIVHLHPTHFRFDQQEGTFTYKSPMKIFIEHLRSGTVPHDLLEDFTQWGITFYEGCLIVEIHDHKSIATTKEPSQATSNAEKTEPFSIHNYNAYLTPSSWVPYPKENIIGLPKPAVQSDIDASKGKSAQERDKENMPAPNQPVDTQRGKSGAAKKAKISTMVLHPTALTAHVDLAIKATTPVPGPTNAGRRESRQDINGITPMSATGPRPQTPMLAIPSTPHLGMDPPPAKKQKREKMELDGKSVHAAESQIVFATTAGLYLEPVKSAAASIRLLQSLVHPEHSGKLPSPKARKKTVAEMAAEESAAADEEQFMLILDERLLSNNGVPGGAGPADGDGQVGGASWEPRFERFKAIEAIKTANVEKKRLEKLQQAENAKRLQQEAEARDRARAEAAKRQEDDQRQKLLAMQQQSQMQQRQQENVRRQMAAQAAQNQQVPHVQMGQVPMPHGHPQQNGTPVNGIHPQQQRFLQQNQPMSQAQVSSPIMRNATPHNLSSPMVATMAVSMQQSNSNMGGSPPRPGSVVQQGHQMTPGMTHPMRPQSSQQSQAGTPRPPNSTPNMAQAVARQNQTPRMAQASPLPGAMGQPHMMAQQQMMPNGQMMNLQAQQAQQIAAAQAQQRMRQQAAQAAMGSSPPNPVQMTAQQYAMAQAQHQLQLQQQQQQQQQQGNPGMMNNQQMQQNYAAQLRAMTQAQANGAMQNPNFMQGNGMTPQMMQQAQQAAAMAQAQQQAQVQAQQQQQHPQGQVNNAQTQFRMMSTRFYQNGIAALQQQWGGNVPTEALNQFKAQCSARAQAWVREQMARQQQQLQMRAQQQAGMQGMGMGMGGVNVNGMQQRPNGM